MKIKVWAIHNREFVSDERKNVTIPKSDYEYLVDSIKKFRTLDSFSIVQEGVTIFINPDNILAIGIIDPPEFDD